jgi:hypothetical protein
MTTMRNILFFSLLSLVLWTACSTEIERPTANAGTSQSNVAVGSVVSLDGSASTDPAELTLAYAWRFEARPAGSKAELVRADTAKPYFTVDMTGTYKVSLVVSNGVAASDAVSVDIVAGKCGAGAPVVASIAFTPAEPAVKDIVGVSATVTHPDDMECTTKPMHTLKYAWKISAAPAGSIAALFAPDTKAPSFIPDVQGDYELTLVVTDEVGHASAPFKQTVKVGVCGQQAPAVAKITTEPAAAPFNVGDPIQLSIAAADLVDPDEDPNGTCKKTESFSYAWQLLAVPAGSKATLNAPNSKMPSFTPDVAPNAMSVYTVGVVVTDSAGLKSALKTLDITVQQCGANPPVVQSITPAGPVNVNTNQLVALSAVVTDKDTDAMSCNLADPTSYNWLLLSAPAGSKAVINQPNAATSSFTPDVAGAYEVGLIPTDSKGHAGALFKSGIITAAQCGATAPNALLKQVFPYDSGAAVNALVISSGMAVTNVNIGNVVQLSAAASNSADNLAPCSFGKTLTYKWQFTELPAGSFNAQLNNTSSVNVSFTPDVAGKYAVSLTVTDSTNLSTKATYTVTVP